MKCRWSINRKDRVYCKVNKRRHDMKGRPKQPIVNCPHTQKKYYAKGMCRNCYIKNKYNTDEDFREKRKAMARKSVKKWWAKKKKEDPDFNARRQREFRKKHPQTFNFLMARHYFKKLTPENKEKFLEQAKDIKQKNNFHHGYDYHPIYQKGIQGCKERKNHQEAFPSERG